MTVLLDPRTTVSGVAELLSLREQIDTLTARCAEVASRIPENAEFMGGKVLRLPYFLIRGVEKAPLGSVFHVALFDREYRDDPDDYDAHEAGKCPVAHRGVYWCSHRPHHTFRLRYSRGTRGTFLGSWVLTGYDTDTKTGTLVAIEEVTS